MFVGCNCGKLLRMTEYNQLKYLRYVNLPGVLSPEMVVKSWHYIMMLEHCPGCKGKDAPKSRFKLIKIKERIDGSNGVHEKNQRSEEGIGCCS